MYGIFIYLHIFGVFVFLLGHGASVNVAFQLKRERNPERVRALLDLSIGSYIGMWIGLLLLLLTGIVAGFLGNHWGRGWVWASIVLLVVLFVFMGAYGARYYGRVRATVGLKPYRRSDQVPLGDVASEQELAALLNSNHAIILALVGLGGLLLILWLMMFKPF